MSSARPWRLVYEGEVREGIIESTLTGFLEEAVDRYTDHTVLTRGETSLSYGELLHISRKLAGALAERGVEKGDRVALMLPNCPEYVISFFAIVRLGAIVTQINPIYVKRELQHLLKDSGATTIIVHQDYLSRVRMIREATALSRVVVTGEGGALGACEMRFDDLVATSVDIVSEAALDPAEDLAALQYTGGTTGISKGAMLTHRNLLANIGQNIELLLEDPSELEGEKTVAVAPLFHIFGTTVVMLTAIRQGMNMLLVERFRAGEMMELVRDERPAMLAGAATIFTALQAYPDMEEYGLNNVRLNVSGGANVPPTLLRAFEKRTGRTIFEAYGLSEGAPVTANTYLRGAITGSIGVPMPSIDLKIVDIETGGQEVSMGDLGELIVKGPQVMRGYWGMPEETSQTLREGWLYTGDIARMDEEGYFYLVDRKKEVIITSGYNVYPREVEEALLQHAEVLEAGAIGVPDEYRGETVKAVLVMHEGSEASEADIVDFCEENLAPYKVPKIVEFRDELPKSAVGKLLRRVLAEEDR